MPQEDDEPVRLNRAAILWKNGDNVKASEAVNNLGFTSFLVFTSTIQYNARLVEDELQDAFMNLGLGYQRLHRSPDRGRKYSHDYSAYHVFLTISFKAQSMIYDGSLRIQV